MEFVTVRTFELPTDLLIARGILESNGIKVNVKDELTVQVDNFLSQAVGGVKLQVLADQLKIANQILEEAGYHKGPPIQYNWLERKFRTPEFQEKLKKAGRNFLILLCIILFFMILF